MKNIKSAKSSEWEEVMAWVSSREFVEIYNLNKKNVEKACFRANTLSKKFCKIKHNILCFSYTQGIGRGGKVLKIWDKPFSSEEEALSFYEREVVGVMENDANTTSTTITQALKCVALK